MNSKRTNRLVAILNVIAIATFYLLSFSEKYLLSSMLTGYGVAKSIFNSLLIDTLLNNLQIIMAVVYSGIGILNIICAIQNKEKKKIFFWQLVFGFYEIWNAIILIFALQDYEFIEWGEKILFGIIPIIFAIINFIFIKKNKPKVIQIISYFGVIVLSILYIFDIIGVYWNIISVLMQLIYIHYQEKNIEESKSTKITNIILYYILQIILVVSFLGIILTSLGITKVNDSKWEKELINLYNDIENLQGAKTKEIYIPVEKNYKYGFVDSKGQEKIKCQYDRVSYFNQVEINNELYYIALAKKDNKFYIISKTNNNFIISGNLEKYLQTIDEHLEKTMTKSINKQEDYRKGYLQIFEFLFQVSTKGEKELTQQTIEKSNITNTITLNEKSAKYYYNNTNFSMIIEPINDDMNNYDKYNYENYYNEDENTSYLSSSNTKHKVTIYKTNGEYETSIIYLPGFNEYNGTLDIFLNGYIEFKDEENEKNGWFDDKGNKITVPNTYTIYDIKDNKAILEVYNIDENAEFYYIIIDMTGKILLQTNAIDVYDDMYLVKNENNKMVLLDKDLNVISNEYDKIISTMEIDLSGEHSSYY